MASGHNFGRGTITVYNAGQVVLEGEVSDFRVEVVEDVPDVQALADQARSHKQIQITGGHVERWLFQKQPYQTALLRQLVEQVEEPHRALHSTHPDTLSFLQKQRQRQERKAGKR